MRYCLGKLCSRLSSGKNIRAEDVHETGKFPVYGANGLRGYSDTSNFDGECALIGRQGAYCGNVKYFCGEGYITEHAVVLQSNQLANTQYLAYQLSLLNLGRLSGQSAQPGLSVKDIAKQIVDIPSLDEQRRIAALLSSLDRKIALNRRKIATLEKMAKEIYDYWFVQYDFPDKNGRPYKSSGGEMVYSPELKREIPKGWRVNLLGDVVDVNKSSHNFESLPEIINYIDISATHQGYIGKPSQYLRNEAPGRARRVAVSGDVVWSCVRPNLRAYALVLSPAENDVFSTGFAVLSPSKIPYSYLYHLVSSESFVAHLVAKAGNSAYPAVLPGDFKTYNLALPPDDVLCSYHSIADKFFKRRQQSFKEIQDLDSLRDFLLPLLMNGQVKIW